MQGQYLIALGSNVRHPRYGSPHKVLAAALARLQQDGLDVLSASPVLDNPSIGPSLRRYANGAVIISTGLRPPALLQHLKQVERDFGRTARGERWRARVLDLDIILWSGGSFASPELMIPHIAFRGRAFVLAPAAAIAAAWIDPVSGLTINQLHTRLTRPRLAPR